MDVVAFFVGEQNIGLPLEAVERVLPSVEITPLAVAPPPVRGIVNIHGAPIPVVDLYHRLYGRWSEPTLDQRLVLVRTERRRLLLIADAVPEVRDLPDAAIADASALLPGVVVLSGIAAGDDGRLLFLHDVERFLSAAEEMQLAAALDAAALGA